MPWFPDLGYDGDLILSNVSGEIIIGDKIERLSSVARIKVDVECPQFILDLNLKSSLNESQSILWAFLTFGSEYSDITATAEIKTHTAIPDLTVGVNPEILYSIANKCEIEITAYLTQNYQANLSGSALINSFSYSFLDDGRGEGLPYQFIDVYTTVLCESGFCLNLQDLTSTCHLHSNVNNKFICDYALKSDCEIISNTTADLYIGNVYEIRSYCHISTNCDGNLVHGGFSELNSIENISTSCDGYLNIGKAQPLSYVNHFDLIQSNVNNLIELDTSSVYLFATGNIYTNQVGEINLGLDEELSSVVDILSAASGNIILGTTEILSSNCELISEITAELIIGDIDELNANCVIESDVTDIYGLDSFTTIFIESSCLITTDSNVGLTTGIITDLQSVCEFSSYIEDALLKAGLDKYISSTCDIKSQVTGNIIPGVIEMLSSTNISTSGSGALIVLGVDEYLSGIINITSNLDGNFILTDNIENLSGIINITSNLDGNILNGVNEYLSSVCELTTNSSSNFSNGLNEWFESTCSIKSSLFSFIDLGINENLSVNCIPSVATSAELTFGKDEYLSGNLHISSNVDSDISLGIITYISSSVIIHDEINIPELKIGDITDLNSTVNIITQFNGSLSFGIAKSLVGHLDISTSVSNFILVGRDEYFSSLCLISSHGIAELTLGKYERLDANCLIESSYIAAKLGIAFYLSNAECLISTLIRDGILSNKINISSQTNIISNLVQNLHDYTFEVISNNRVRKFTYDLPVTFAKVVINSNLNKSMIPFGSEYIADNIPLDNSFIDVLFRDDYEPDYYRYLYRRVLDKSTWPPIVLTRLMLDPENAQYFRCDGDDVNLHNYNLYSLQNDDLLLLNYLLEYRNTKNTNHRDTIYNNLSSNLSRMIYIYLDVKLYDDNSKYPADISMSAQGDILENCFEVYLVENIFNQISKSWAWS